MADIFTLENLVSLITLTIMEIVLGIDNVLFVSIIAGKLPRASQNKARFTGLTIALLIRIGLLFIISALTHLTNPLFNIGKYPINTHSIIMVLGGGFLMYKSILEINEKVGGRHDNIKTGNTMSFSSAVFQIILIDIIFSVDSILTAIGVAKNVWIMILAVIISMYLMLAGSGALSRIFNKYPSIKMLALAFLLMIGFLLVVDGLPGDMHIEIPKSYLYVAMAFAFGVELLNIRMRKNMRKTHKD